MKPLFAVAAEYDIILWRWRPYPVVQTAIQGAYAISHNTWIHCIARVAIAKPLVGTKVVPNQLTTARLATGLAAAAVLAVGETPWQHLGGALFVLSLLLDRADGELARLTGTTSSWGHTYDLFADAASDLLIFVGLGIGLRNGIFGQWAMPLGFLAGAAVVAIYWLVIRIEVLKGARMAEMQGFYGFDVDDAIVVVPVAIWLGWSEPLLAAAALGAPLFAVFFFILFWRKLAAAEPEQGGKSPQHVSHRAHPGQGEKG